jgi:hypothetical protein
VNGMEKQSSGFTSKFVIIVCIIGLCILAFIFGILPYISRGEGDSIFGFIEVPYNETVNSTVIHLKDSDFMNKQGLYVRWGSGKLDSIAFRNSDNPAILPEVFNGDYGSRPGNKSSRKYIEYNGSYYYGVLMVK